MSENKSSSSNENNVLISSNINDNISLLQNIYSNCEDIIFRKLTIQNIEIYIIYVNNLVDKLLLTEGVLKNISEIQELSIEKLKDELPIGRISLIDNLSQGIDKIFSGEVLVFMEGNIKAAVINIAEYAVTKETQTEPSIMGNKDAFTNNIAKNIALLRRYIPNVNLKAHSLTIGRNSKTSINVVYLDNIANNKIVNEVINRLNSIDIDLILDSTNIAELIEDNPYSPFPAVNVTERIDKVVGNLHEGQIAILVDKTPFVLIAPSTFVAFFQVSDDYYNSFYISTLTRWLRYISYFTSIFLPGFYISITNYNHELIPIRMLITLSSQRRTLPFPPIVEILLMLIGFELLRELGTRLPKTIGSTVSLVGALIIGEIAVKAGIVSATVVITGALTGITSMIIPSRLLYESVIYCRILCLFFSSIMGIFGLFISVLFILGHLSSIRSFGIPYTYPLSPYNKEDIDDILIRAPIWKIKKRPILYASRNRLKFRSIRK